ncbi:MAG: ACT domain-containing protein [Candidatus Aenigmarchaeota archaeon]|nr:ACT domain-containing protein [Candidatus Aenigmarchaeota archaeon]
MRNSNITRVDSKGRILIPIHIRKMLGADDGTEIIIIPEHDRSQVRMLPLVREKTAEIRILMNDVPGSLAHIADSLAAHNVNIIMSESRTIQKGKLAEWDVIIDTSEANGSTEKLRGELERSRDIRKVEVVRD